MKNNIKVIKIRKKQPKTQPKNQPKTQPKTQPKKLINNIIKPIIINKKQEQIQNINPIEYINKLINHNTIFKMNQNILKSYEIVRYKIILSNIHNMGELIYTNKEINPIIFNTLKRYLDYSYKKTFYNKVIHKIIKTNILNKINIEILNKFIYKLVIIYKTLLQKDLYLKIDKLQLDDFFMKSIFFYTLYIIHNKNIKKN